MLVLTRKDTEEIRIGDSITIRVIKSRQGKATIGIMAPREVKVLRDELVGKTDGDASEGGA